MRQSIYLHQSIVDVMRCYGTLDEVVNRILELGAAGEFDILHKPPCPNRTTAGRYEIEITEPNYLEMLEMFGPYSSKVSIRRIIYWFIENELYEEYGWEPISEYKNKRKELLNKKLSNALNEMEKSKRYALGDMTESITAICENIKNLQEYLKNG